MMTLDTPTGRLVSDAAPETDEWFTARREGITATDLPKILGLSKYGNALSVWLDKRGELHDTVGEAGEWGHLLEDVVAQEWARRNDCDVTRVGVIAHVEQDWQRASLDRLVAHCDDAPICGLEVKTRSAFVSGLWSDDLPDDVLAQVEWQLLVSGLPHMHVACLIGGQRLASYTVEPDLDLRGLLVDEATRIWGHVQSGNPPKVDPDALLAKLLDQLYSHRVGARTVPPVEAEERISDYQAAGRDEKAAKTRKAVARAALIAFLEDGEVALIDDVPAYTYKANKAGTRSIRLVSRFTETEET